MLVAARLIWPLIALALALLLNLLLVFWFVRGGEAGMVGLLLIFSILVAIAAFAIGVNRLRNRLLAPLVQLERAVGDVCQGEPWTTLI